jgi:cell division protein FtsQ
METKERRRTSDRPAAAQKRRVPTKSAPQRPARRPRPERRKRRAEDPQTVYTQPPAFSGSGFGVRIATVAAVVLALTLGMSIFFKVENVTVSGSEKYSPWDVRVASGIQDGENLLTLNKAKIVAKIRSQLPYADEIRVGIKLPDTVNIEIVELDVVYAIQEQDSGWWLMNAQGKLLEPVTDAQANGYTRILGVKLASPQVGAQAVAAEQTPAEEGGAPEESTEPTLSPVVTVLGSEQLNLVLSVLQTLENNGITGTVNYLDVTSITQVSLRYDERFNVFLGDSNLLDRKIRSMKEAVASMNQYQAGELDVSFTTWPDKVIFTPEADEIT